MLRHRLILLILTVVLVVGSVSGTIGYALYVRSDTYRHATERDLSALLNLPVEIGGISPLSFSSREFSGVRTWLPQRQTQVFACDRAVWREVTRGGHLQYALDLHDGWLLVGTGSWTRTDYDAILKSGLGLDFADLALAEVHIDDVDFRWDHPDFQLSARQAVGEVLFDKNGTARASLISRRLNEHSTREPINIHATFVPGAGLQFEEVVLDVPALPMAALGLDKLLGGPVTLGTFAGRVVYREDDRPVLDISGSVDDARLEELTRQVIGGPFRGAVNVAVDQAEFVDRKLRRLRFRGRLHDVHLADLLPVLRSPGVTGRLTLDVAQFDARDGHIQRLNLSGEAADLPLEPLAAALGYGRITGQLHVRIHSLSVVDDSLRAADVDLIVTPPTDGPGTISRELIQRMVQELLSIDLSRVLPNEVEYTELGAKLLVSGDRLTIRGTHGADGTTILTVKLLGQEWGLIDQPDRSFEIGDVVAQARQWLEQQDIRELRDWWDRQHRSPGPPP